MKYLAVSLLSSLLASQVAAGVAQLVQKRGDHFTVPAQCSKEPFKDAYLVLSRVKATAFCTSWLHISTVTNTGYFLVFISYSKTNQLGSIHHFYARDLNHNLDNYHSRRKILFISAL